MTKTLVFVSQDEARIFQEELRRSERLIFGFMKRGMDIFLAFVVGLITFFLFPFIAAAIKLESKGPIFFKQRRVGKDGKVFELLKFRSTFRTAVDETLGWDKEEGDIYTKSGKFLRKTYLDELPQFINILKGDMSFIGPRPERPEFVSILKKEIPFYEMRFLVRPGITGWAQISMENDAAAKDAAEKLKYDLYYIKNRSVALDLKIALKTLFLIMQREGR